MSFSGKTTWHVIAPVFVMALLLLTACAAPKDGRGAEIINYDQMAVMDTASQQPTQLVSGGKAKLLPAKPSNVDFTAMRDYWSQTGGKALLVWHNGQIIFEDYADGVNENSRSRSYSLHKSIVGLVAATMAYDGVINLDDPVSMYVPQFRDTARQDITIRRALYHSTGLSRFSLASGSLESRNLLLGDRIEATALSARLEHDPDIFAYANVNYQIAGAALRNALKQKTGLSYAEYLSRRIWAPLGASDAYLWSESKDGAPRFYAGMQARAKDWLRVGIAIAGRGKLGGKQIFPAEVLDDLTRPAPTNPNYGLGVWLGSPEDGTREYSADSKLVVPHSAPFAFNDILFFDGFGGQRAYISSSQDLVVVRIGDIRFDWDDSILFNLAAAAIEQETSVVTSSLTLNTDTGREVALRLIEPSTPCDNCRLMLFSTGAFAAPDDYDRILFPIAKAGFRIAIPLHPDSKKHPDKDKYGPDDWLDLRLEDVRLTLQYFSKENRPPEWIAAGHSFGALTAQILGGAEIEKAGKLLPLAMGPPTRIVALSPPGKVEGYIAGDAFRKIAAPMLLVTGSNDTVPIYAPKWQDHLLSHQNAPPGLSTAVIFDDIDHYFNGLYGRPNERSGTAADQALMKILVAFLLGQALPAPDSGYRIEGGTRDQ